MNSEKIRYVSSNSEKAIHLSDILEKKYKISKFEDGEECEVVIVLGGDGFMLEAIRRFIDAEFFLYGINCGHVGFLLNGFCADGLIEDINKSFEFNPRVLKIEIEFDDNIDKIKKICYAVNDCYIIRKTQKTTHLKIFVDNILRLEKLVGDGVIISTPFGSTAYNASAGGPILPIDSSMITVTPINTFYPRFFKGAILNDNVKIQIDVIDDQKRPVSVCADLQEFSLVKSVRISKEEKKKVRLLFKSKEYLYNKSICYQFS